MDVPLVVNRAIIGGWKYVHPETGEFFDGAHNVAAAFQKVLAPTRRLSPRAWFKYAPCLQCVLPIHHLFPYFLKGSRGKIFSNSLDSVQCKAVAKR